MKSVKKRLLEKGDIIELKKGHIIYYPTFYRCKNLENGFWHDREIELGIYKNCKNNDLSKKLLPEYYLIGKYLVINAYKESSETSGFNRSSGYGGYIVKCKKINNIIKNKYNEILELEKERGISFYQELDEKSEPFTATNHYIKSIGKAKLTETWTILEGMKL